MNFGFCCSQPKTELSIFTIKLNFVFNMTFVIIKIFLAIMFIGTLAKWCLLDLIEKTTGFNKLRPF